MDEYLESLRRAFNCFSFSSYTRPFIEPAGAHFIPTIPSWDLNSLYHEAFHPEQDDLDELIYGKRPKLESFEDTKLPRLFNALLSSPQLTTPVLEESLHQIVEAFPNECKKITVLEKFAIFAKEKCNDDLIATSFYRRALAIEQNANLSAHYNALIVGVDKIDKDQLNRVQEKIANLCDRLISLDWSYILRDSFYRNVKHTCAIEGNKLTLKQVYERLTKGPIESEDDENGSAKSELEDRGNDEAICTTDPTEEDWQNDSLAILGAARAFAFVLESTVEYANAKKRWDESGTADKKEEEQHRISAEFVVQIHQRMMEQCDGEIAGQYFQYPLKGITQEAVKLETEKMVDWIDKSLRENGIIDRISLAAVSHYLLLAVHSFTDGNGRTYRAFLNFLLMISGYPPVVISSNRDKEYFRALKIAYWGDLRPIIRFIADCIEKTADQMLRVADHRKSPQDLHAAEEKFRGNLVEEEEEEQLNMVEKPRLAYLDLSTSCTSWLNNISPITLENSKDQSGSGSSSQKWEKSRKYNDNIFVFPPSREQSNSSRTSDSGQSIESTSGQRRGHHRPNHFSSSSSSAAPTPSLIHHSPAANWALLFLRALCDEST